MIKNNYIKQTTSSQHCIEFSDAATGCITDNILVAPTLGSVLDPGSMYCSGNTWTADIDAGGEPIPDETIRDPKVHGTGRVFYVDASGSNGSAILSRSSTTSATKILSAPLARAKLV